MAAGVIGKRKTTVDQAGNPVLSSAGDFAKGQGGQWFALHPATGLANLLRSAEPIVEHVDGTITATSVVTLSDGSRWGIFHGAWSLA